MTTAVINNKSLIKTNVSIADQVVANSAQTTQSIENTTISSLDSIEKQATDAYNKTKSANNKIMTDTSKSIVDMTKTAVTSVATASTTAGGGNTNTGTNAGIPTPTAASIRATPVYDVNTEIGANMSMKIFALLQTWSTQASGGTKVYLDSEVINNTLRESVKSRRATFVVQ